MDIWRRNCINVALLALKIDILNDRINNFEKDKMIEKSQGYER
jgi:hypothetical protein